MPWVKGHYSRSTRSARTGRRYGSGRRSTRTTAARYSEKHVALVVLGAIAIIVILVYLSRH